MSSFWKSADRIAHDKAERYILLDSIIAKLRIDILLLFLRAIVIILWVILLLSKTHVAFWVQLSFVAVIFISDAVDGIISRRYTTERQKYWFRVFDALIDKIGMLIFLLVLYSLDRADLAVVLCIIGYNIALTILPIIRVLWDTIKKLSWIQATLLSRFYAVSVGFYCFLSLNIEVTTLYNQVCLKYFIILGMLSLLSHWFKIIKIKKVV